MTAQDDRLDRVPGRPGGPVPADPQRTPRAAAAATFWLGMLMSGWGLLVAQPVWWALGLPTSTVLTVAVWCATWDGSR